MSKETISRERLAAPPGTIYAETILEPSHLFMLEHYFSPLASTNKAWTVMLVETGIVDGDGGAALLDAILDLEAAGPEAIGDFDPRYEYFYSHVERFLTERIGEEIAGEINIARTRPEPLTPNSDVNSRAEFCDTIATRSPTRTPSASSPAACARARCAISRHVLDPQEVAG